MCKRRVLILEQGVHKYGIVLFQQFAGFIFTYKLI